MPELPKNTSAHGVMTAVQQLGLSQQQREASLLAVRLAQQLGAAQAEAAYHYSQGFDISVRQQKLEQLEQANAHELVITLYRKPNHQSSITPASHSGYQQGSASTHSLQPQHIEQAVSRAYAAAAWTGDDCFAGLAARDQFTANSLSSTPHVEQADLQLYHHWDIELEQAIEQARQAEALAMQTDPRLTQGEGTHISSHYLYSNMANSHGLYLEKSRSSHSNSCSLLASADQQMQRDYAYSQHCNPQQLINMQTLAQQAATKTLARLGARKISTRTCSVIFDKHCARGIWRALLNALSGSAQYNKQTFLLDSLQKTIAPDWLNLTQKPHLLQAVASRYYDSDGLPTKDRSIIANGKVASYLLSTYSARQLGMTTTANAGGIQNICVDGNMATTEDLIQSMQQGLLVTDLMGQGVNRTTGHYSRGAFGYWVEHGKIQYPVHEITLAGNLLEMLQQLHGCSNDHDLQHSIRCGAIWFKQMTLAGS